MQAASQQFFRWLSRKQIAGWLNEEKEKRKSNLSLGNCIRWIFLREVHLLLFERMAKRYKLIDEPSAIVFINGKFFFLCQRSRNLVNHLKAHAQFSSFVIIFIHKLSFALLLILLLCSQGTKIKMQMKCCLFVYALQS